MYRRFHRWLVRRYYKTADGATGVLTLSVFDPLFYLWLMLPTPGLERE